MSSAMHESESSSDTFYIGHKYVSNWGIRPFVFWQVALRDGRCVRGKFAFLAGQSQQDIARQLRREIVDRLEKNGMPPWSSLELTTQNGYRWSSSRHSMVSDERAHPVEKQLIACLFEDATVQSES